MEDEVEECAGELHEINDALAEQIEGQDKLYHELGETKRKLAAMQVTLADKQDDLAVAHKVAEEAKQHSLHDFATGLPNRELLNDRLEQAIALAKRNNWLLAVMFIDLDRFKLVNDTYGHAIGDRVLQVVAQRLEEHVRNGDAIYRYGGDEFLYLLVNLQETENIHRVAEKLFAYISQTMVINDLELTIAPSIGISVYPTDGEIGPELRANADAAMYRAKNTKAGYVFFDTIKDRSTRDLP